MSRVVSASCVIDASADVIFELIADPAQQPRWDGNNNLSSAPTGQRVRAVGDVFEMFTTRGNHKENHVVEFVEGRVIAWEPADAGQRPFGHVWRWVLDPITPSQTNVTHAYDWTGLTDDVRIERAKITTADWLAESITRLKRLAEETD